MNPVGVKRWAAGLSARCDAWDGACALGLKRLETLESTLRAEADEALATVVAAVEEYAGPIMDQRAREKLVRKRCVRVYDKRNADARITSSAFDPWWSRSAWSGDASASA